VSLIPTMAEPSNITQPATPNPANINLVVNIAVSEETIKELKSIFRYNPFLLIIATLSDVKTTLLNREIPFQTLK
jgi:hypothetical protein